MSAQPERKPRPRRWCDAGTPGRQSVTASQEAGVEGVRNPRSHKTQYPALSRQRTAGFNNPDGQAGSPPPQCPPNLKENRDHADGATLGRRDARASRRPRRPGMRAETGTAAGIRGQPPGQGVFVSMSERTNPRRYTTIAGGTPAPQTSHRPLSRPRVADDGTNPRRYTTIACGTPAPQTSHRPLSRPRVADDGTNPHRYATIADGTSAPQTSQHLCSARFSRTMEPTDIGTPPEGAMRSAVPAARPAAAARTTERPGGREPRRSLKILAVSGI